MSPVIVSGWGAASAGNPVPEFATLEGGLAVIMYSAAALDLLFAVIVDATARTLALGCPCGRQPYVVRKDRALGCALVAWPWVAIVTYLVSSAPDPRLQAWFGSFYSLSAENNSYV